MVTLTCDATVSWSDDPSGKNGLTRASRPLPATPIVSAAIVDSFPSMSNSDCSSLGAVKMTATAPTRRVRRPAWPSLAQLEQDNGDDERAEGSSRSRKPVDDDGEGYDPSFGSTTK